MCMTEQSELAYQAMDETAEWGAKNRKVVQLARRHELDEHVKPEPAHSLTVREAVLWVGGSIALMVLILAVAASHS